MAFCPNCGTPNTDQAEKCVSCAFELAPKQKSKFKGTIMMSGVQAPTAPGQPAAAPPPAAPQPAPAPQPAAQPAPAGPAKNLAFEKTMMGQMAPPVAPTPAARPREPSPAEASADLGRAATVEQPAPSFDQPQAHAPSFADAPAPTSAPAGAPMGTFSDSPVGQSQASGGSGSWGGATQDVDVVPKKSAGKLVAVGCAGALVLACVILGALALIKGKQFLSLADRVQIEGPTLEWRTRVTQSLGNVLEICKTDCEGAAVYFHPQRAQELMGAAKDLNEQRLAKLVDPTQSEARMLDGTEDVAIATALNLDPLQCVRIVAGSAKVVGCSVPDTSGAVSLRIVHIEGLSSL